MPVWKDILFGRPDGVRSKLKAMILGGSSAPKPSSAKAEPAPRGEAAERALNLGIEPPKDVTPPDGFEVVLHRDALKAGQVIEVIIAGNAIAVGNVDGTFYACSNSCPHAEGPLGEGSLQGSTLTCPYHGWQFDLRDGSCLTSPDDPVHTYPVQVVGDAVCVAV